MKKTKWIGCTSILLAVSPVLSLTSLTSCTPDTPIVNKVKINAPEKVYVNGNTIKLDVTVDAPEETSKEVTWSIVCGSTNASLSDDGELTPGNKTGTISITAASKANPAKYDTVLIQIDDEPVVVESVSISGAESVPAEGSATKYSATVIGRGVVPQDVTWSIIQTKTKASIDEEGNLSPGNIQGTIQVVATSIFDPNKSGKFDVEITKPESKLPEIYSRELIENPDVYMCVESYLWGIWDPYTSTGDKFGIDVHLFNDSVVPYVDVNEYVSYWMNENNEGLHKYRCETKNKKSTIQNMYYGAINVTCIIDYDRQTLTFGDYDKFTNDSVDRKDPLTTGASGGEEYFVDVVSNYTPSTNQYVIDLSKYHINVYYDEDGHGYLPYYVFTNIIERHQKTELFFDGEAFYTVPSAYSSWTSWETVLANSWTFTKDLPIFEKEYMEFCYNLLALSLDVKFGLIERPSRGRPGTIIKYFENGAYAALEPYHDDLVSADGNTSNAAIRDFFNHECDDGGHAGYSTVNLLAESPLSGQGRGPETSYTSDVATLMASGRSAEGHDLPENAIGQVEIESSTEGANDIAWVTLDSFTSPEEVIDYDDVTSSNYMYDTISLTMYLKQIVGDGSSIKKVVLDLTNNGGGAVYTEHFLASYLCGGRNMYAQQPSREKQEFITGDNGGVTESIYNPHTGAFSKYTVWADINSDGEYNDEDHLPSNVELWCITSNYSFSCGNMLPCNLADCSDCKFIGDRTGGGACFVDGSVNMGLGNAYRGSSIFHMLKNTSTPNNIISVEEGVIPEAKYFIRNTYENMTDFFYRPDLIELMKS